jgi:hypothetical protein
MYVSWSEFGFGTGLRGRVKFDEVVESGSVDDIGGRDRGTVGRIIAAEGLEETAIPEAGWDRAAEEETIVVGSRRRTT